MRPADREPPVAAVTGLISWPHRQLEAAVRRLPWVPPDSVSTRPFWQCNRPPRPAPPNASHGHAVRPVQFETSAGGRWHATSRPRNAAPPTRPCDGPTARGGPYRSRVASLRATDRGRPHPPPASRQRHQVHGADRPRAWHRRARAVPASTSHSTRSARPHSPWRGNTTRSCESGRTTNPQPTSTTNRPEAGRRPGSSRSGPAPGG